MITLPPEFTEQLEAKRREVEEARRALSDRESELRGWEQAAKLLITKIDHTTEIAPRHRDRPQNVVDGGFGSKRSLSERWRAILAGMVNEYPQPSSFDDLELLAEVEGHKTDRNTLRSQMSLYAKNGFVERVGDARYRITEAGAKAAGKQLPKNEGR